ncbi:uncharacterized protein arhgef5 isoform X1 [Pungitius pungitius]|uniref:uncharacterized protein arhgef5 isoform X1 n=1 Tax=Pungitius pungitius TaxID=134920 RepID=UPI002E126BBA
MGTKRPGWNLFDTLSSKNKSDSKLPPGGKISRDPSPSQAMNAQTERERRDSKQEEDRRNERETLKKRDKARNKETDPRIRYYERDQAPAPRLREGEREWRERERRQGDDRSRNGRPLSYLEKITMIDVESATKKGDTFPRMRKPSTDRVKGMPSNAGVDEERGEIRRRDGPRRAEPDDWERERERARQRERYREWERNEIRSRGKEEGTYTIGRPGVREEFRKRERYRDADDGFKDRIRERGHSLDRRERDAGRKREKPRPNMGEREARVPSPHNPRVIYPDRNDREMAPRGEGRRDTRSEGDSDERERKRERVRHKERQELTYHHSRSEGDDAGKMQRERDQDRKGYREEDRQRYRDGDRDVDRSRRKGAKQDEVRYREVDRRVEREGGGSKERVTDLKYDKREGDRNRQYEQRTGRKVKEGDLRRDDKKAVRSLSQTETLPRVPPQVQSSGGWSSDMDCEVRYRRYRDSNKDRESGRHRTAGKDGDVEKQRNTASERSQREERRHERQDRVRGEMTMQRRMWLEPQRGQTSKEEFVDRERHAMRTMRRSEEERSQELGGEWEREGRRVKEEPEEKYLGKSHYREKQEGRNGQRGDGEREGVGVSVDGEEVGGVEKGGMEHQSDGDGGIERSWQSETEAENVRDHTEESDREEEGEEGSYSGRSENEGGSETGWRRDRVQSGEDGFVTVSSGGDDEEDEREEEFEDCPEFWEGASDGRPPVAVEGCEGDMEEGTGKEEADDEAEREKQKKYVFCVIGQTMPRSKPTKTSPSQLDHMEGVETGTLNIEIPIGCSEEAAQRPHPDLSRNDDPPIIVIQDTEIKSGFDPPGEERPATGEATGGDVRHTELRNKVEPPIAIKRDLRTEKLLTEWREKNQDGVEDEREPTTPVPSNPYGDVCSELNMKQIQPLLEAINAAAMSPEEVEAIRIRLSGTWSMSEEPKRHSQAPHLKWAKDILQEILGHSEENTVDDPQIKSDNGQRREATEAPVSTVGADKRRSEPELQEEEPLEVEGLRGMEQSQNDMHADDKFTSMHVGDTPTYTHADIPLGTEGKEDQSLDKVTEPSGHLQLEDAVVEESHSEEVGEEVKLSEMEKEARREKEMYLSVSNTLYKPNSCPILNYESESDLLVPSRKGQGGQELEERSGESEEEIQREEPGQRSSVGDVGEISKADSREGEVVTENKKAGGTLKSSCSFRDLGHEARFRRRGIRKTTERRNGEHLKVEEKEDDGAGRDRRTRIFSTTDDEDDDKSKSWGEVELRTVLDTIERRKRNSRFFNAAQLYQQYSEAAQNFEIQRQARPEVVSLHEDNIPSPSPHSASRPLPPIPPVPHPHSLPHVGSVTSAKNLPLPEPPKSEGRPSSPRLSVSLSQSSTLWRELPGVRGSGELEELTEDQRRLQEVRFEVVTSEASYCRSLDIVVEHFVQSKPLGALLTTQDRNWLFSRLADVRAISHSFLSKLEERVESDMIQFTVCDIIARHCQRFKMVYVPYLTNQSYQDATYQRLMNENPGFRRIVERLERSPVCQRLPLRSFLVLPFQRITRIKLLVQNIVKRTTPGTVEAAQAIKSLKLLEKMIQQSNDSITQMKSIESLVSLNAKVDFECRTLPLISQSRRLVREGALIELMDNCQKETERSVYLHLFNDYLLLSLLKEGGRFTVIDHCPVSDLRAENFGFKLHSLQKNLFRLHMTHRSPVLRTDTHSDKLRWMSALSPTNPEIDFFDVKDLPQMQCIRAIVSQQPDELSLEKADIIQVHQQSSDHWVEGTRLSDRSHGWVPESHLETITNPKVRRRNLEDALKLTTATGAV